MKIKEESLPQAWARLCQLLNTLPDHPLKKNEILDILYNGLIDASRDFLDSCASCVFREQTVGQAGELFNNILKFFDDWTLPEPPPKPTPKKRGIDATPSSKKREYKGRSDLHGVGSIHGWG